jgi:PAS domain S-box-containing protein
MPVSGEIKMKSRDNKKRVYEFLTQNQIRERVIENREDAVVVTDRKAVVEMINPGFTRLFGYTEKEALGRHVCDLITPEKSGAALRRSINSSFDDGKTRGKIVRSRKNGKKIGVLSHISPIMMDNETIGSFALYRVVGSRLPGS